MAFWNKMSTKFKDVILDPEYKDIIDEAKARRAFGIEYWRDQFEQARTDLEFCNPERQWPTEVRAQRQADGGRPCLVVDRTKGFINHVVNSFTSSRPAIVVNPVGDGVDRETAEIFQGMIRGIDYNSKTEMAKDKAYSNMVKCGLGYIRICTDYVDVESFNQEIKIERILDPLTVIRDPAGREAPDGSKDEWCFVDSWYTKEAFQAEFPQAKLSGAQQKTWKDLTDKATWADSLEAAWGRDTDGVQYILVTEYFKRVYEDDTLFLLSTGESKTKEQLGDKAKIGSILDNGTVVIDQRTTQKPIVHWYKMTASEVLAKTIWPDSDIPIIPWLGEEEIIDGKPRYYGLVSRLKDPAQLYNMWISAQAEMIQAAPRAPFIGPRGFMGNRAHIWAMSARKAVAALEYEQYDEEGRQLAPPTREYATAPIGHFAQAMANSVDDMKAVTGIFDPSLGNREASQSGAAIRQLQQQGSLGNYHFQNNAILSMTQLGRILIRVIPKLYPTPEAVKIVNPDGSVSSATVGKMDAQGIPGFKKVYDITVGRFDVMVSVGPSYQTRRQENLAAIETMMQGPLGQIIAQSAPDVVVKMLDSSIAHPLEARIKKMLPPGLADDDQQNQAPIPPQAQQQLEQSKQMIDQLTQQLNAMTQKIEQKQPEIESREKIAALNAQVEMFKTLINDDRQNSRQILDIQRDILKQVSSLEGQATPSQANPGGMQRPQMPQQPMGLPDVQGGIPGQEEWQATPNRGSYNPPFASPTGASEE